MPRSAPLAPPPRPQPLATVASAAAAATILATASSTYEAEAASTSASGSGSGSASGLPARLPKPYLRLSTLDLSQGGRFAEGSGKRREIWPRGRFLWAHFLGSFFGLIYTRADIE
jgi:hypothetical protein